MIPDPLAIPARRRFDAIVVGAGSGGLTVAVGLGRFGRRVLLVERRWMGGDCTNTGCIPSKSLLHQSSQLGLASPDAPPAVESAVGREPAVAALARVRARRDALRVQELEEFGGADGVTFVYGHARLASAGSVTVTHPDGTPWTAEADHVVLSTGSGPRRLDIPGVEVDRLITNDELFELSEPPGHLAVIGGGAVGLEMALAFRRLGSGVTVIELADQLLPGVLPEASRRVTRALAEIGVEVHTGRRVVEGLGDGRLLLAGPAGPGDAAPPDNGRVITDSIPDVDLVLVAVGRIPNSADLGLEELGVATDDRGAVVVDGRGRTSVEGVWALGDVSTTGGTTHHAAIWGRRIVQSIVHPLLPVGAEPLRPSAVFTEPEVAMIGEQPPTAPDDVLRITVDGSAIDRSYTDESAYGLLVVDVRPPTGEVLGATVVGPAAAEIIATFSLAMKTRIAFHRWYGTVVPYPTYSELITVAVEEYLSQTVGDVGGHTLRWLRGLVGRITRRATGDRTRSRPSGR